MRQKRAFKAETEAGISLLRPGALLLKGPQEGTLLAALERRQEAHLLLLLPSFPPPFGTQRKPRQTLTALSHQRELRLQCSKREFAYLKKKAFKNHHLGGSKILKTAVFGIF